MNHLTNPIGYEMQSFVFSYVIEEAKGSYQTEARIRIAKHEDMKEIIADTGWKSDIDSLGHKLSLAVRPRSRYYWEVSAKANSAEESVSELQYFETGKMDEDWHGKWITCDKEKERHPRFKKNINIQGKIKHARLYICGLGLYEAYLDQQRIGEEYLTPYCNDYKEWVQYQTYDITEQIKTKKEVHLQVLLGNGWYKGRFGFDRQLNHSGFYGDSWKLIAEVHLDYEDGGHEVIGTDESWCIERSSLTFSNIYDGEWCDDTLEDLPEEEARLDEWELSQDRPQLMARYSTPVTIHEEISPKELIHTPSGEIVLDLKQNITGSFRLRVQEPKGTKIQLQFGEVMQNGNFYRDNLRTAKAEYRYISDGHERILTPHFTFYGYRYVKITGITKFCMEDFTGLALYSNICPVGAIRTGNEKVNQLLSNVSWSQKGNFLDVPTDCPQRDERMGWTGDAQVFAPTASFLTDSYAFYRKYLYDIGKEQIATKGMVPNVVPSFGYEGTSSVWGDAICIIPWVLYQFYGDATILEEAYDSMVLWLSYIDETVGGYSEWIKKFHFGDWLALDHPSESPDESAGGTDEDFIAAVYYWNSLKLTANAAEVLGRWQEARNYADKAEEILRDIRKEYFTVTGRCAITTQTAYVLALYYNLTTDRDKTAKLLERNLQLRSNKLQTGFVGTPLLMPALSEAGLSGLAYEILLSEEYPGWLYEVNLGATTIWERWNSMNEDGSVSSTGMNSFNHYAYGSVVEWMWRYGAGMNPDMEAPGFRKMVLQPQFDYQLKELEATYHSAAGTYRSSWKVLDKSHVEYSVTVPFGCQAKLKLPFVSDETLTKQDNPMFWHVENGICILEAGTYRVSYCTTKPLAETYHTGMPVKKLLENKRVANLIAKAMPGITALPSSMKEVPLKKLMERYMPEQKMLEEKMAQLNQLLSED